MSAERKSAENRHKDLRLAIFRIEKGQADPKNSEMSISAVAREAGVSPSLIHNHYPTIAERIRRKQDASSRQQRDAKHAELRSEQDQTKLLRDELSATQLQVARLASINESLLVELQVLRAKLVTGNVVDLRAS